VSDCATGLEFRIYPEQTVQVSDAMAVAGRLNEARYVPRRNVEPGLMELPLGSVVDWYRFDANTPVPEGFAICDGATVTDTGSPFVGRPTPNLASKFVRGVVTVNSIGSQGGSDSFSGNTGVPHQGGGDPPGGFWRILKDPFFPWNLAANEHHFHPFTVPTVPAYVGLLKIIRIK
jgi:hypothetical protein